MTFANRRPDSPPFSLPAIRPIAPQWRRWLLCLIIVWGASNASAQSVEPARPSGTADPSAAAVAEPILSAESAPVAKSAPIATPIPAETREIARNASRVVMETNLAEVLEARARLDEDLEELQRELGSDGARGREEELKRDIRALSQARVDLDRSFSELASGFDPSSIAFDEAGEELNLSSEIRVLLEPLVNELKRATSRPREIDRLRTEIAQLDERLAQIASARRRVDRLRAEISDPKVVGALEIEMESWERRDATLLTARRVAKQKLDQRLGETKSVRDTVENLFQLFFKSRGRNLLIAFLITLVFLLGLRKLRDFVTNRPALSKNAKSIRGRIFSLTYTIFMAVGALLVFLLALYFFGDWVLLILVLLLILGIVWTSKRAIPRFWGQAVLLLDMGPVREGERLLLNGLPWRVESISFYTDLVNPALEGGTIRLPIDDLSNLRSRPVEVDEPWFPTRADDVILMSDGRPAIVEFQSPEIVRLCTAGKNRIVQPAVAFAAQAVERLSNGYRVDITFGLDYADQAHITTSMVETLGRGIDAGWRASRWAEAMITSAVEFEAASASSLDLFVRVDLDGRSAIDLEAQKRLLASICVDVCNEQGWNIPFSQLTLHVAGETAPGAEE